MPGDVPVFTDACEIGYRMQTDWISHGPRLFFYPSNYITLGWAFPAALGAAVALGGRPVASVSGDGGFLMTAQELATAARYRLRVIAIVHNDSTYGAIKNIQDRNHERALSRRRAQQPRFPRALAARLRRAGPPRDRSRTNLMRRVREALDRDGPSLIEVPDQWRYLRDVANPSLSRRSVGIAADRLAVGAVAQKPVNARDRSISSRDGPSRRRRESCSSPNGSLRSRRSDRPAMSPSSASAITKLESRLLVRVPPAMGRNLMARRTRDRHSSGDPVLRSVERVPETHPERRALVRDFAEQDRVSWAIDDLVVSDPAIQVEDAVVVGVDRRVDVVVAAGIADRRGRTGVGRAEQGADHESGHGVIGGVVHALRRDQNDCKCSAGR